MSRRMKPLLQPWQSSPEPRRKAALPLLGRPEPSGLTRAEQRRARAYLDDLARRHRERWQPAPAGWMA